MDSNVFDHLTRSLAIAPTRRGALGVLAAGIGSFLAGARFPGQAESKNKHKRRKKPKKNAFGCLDIGKACNGKNSKCCSGVCQGKRPKKGDKDKSECKAHNVGSCLANQDNCVASTGPCGTEGACFRTTGNASICGASGARISCKRDTDCAALGFGGGAGCVVCGECQAVSGTACVPAAA